MSKYRFEEIAINCTQKRFPTEEDQPLYIGLEHLDTGNLHVDRWGSSVPLKGEKLVMRKGDVLLGRRNAYLRRAAVAPHDGLFSAHGMVLQPREDVIDRDFFPLFIASDYFFDEANRISVGSLSPTINWKDLRNVEFELPNKDKQRELAKVLWAMDATKRSYQKLLDKTDELVRAQFDEMFGNPITNEMKWHQQCIGDLFDLVSRGKQPQYVDDSIIRVINQACIYWDCFKWENVKYHDAQSSKKTLMLENGSILINSTGTGTLGRCNVFYKPDNKYTYVVDSHVTVLSGSEKIHPIFFKCFFSRRDVQKKVFAECVNGSTNQIELSKEKLSNINLIVPPMKLQNQFAHFVLQSDKSKSELQQSLAELTATYKKIISDNLG